MDENIVQKSEEFAKKYYKKNDALHQWNHVLNVREIGLRLAGKFKDLDLECLKLAIIFHDIDYSNPELHTENSIKIAEKFLTDNGYSPEKIKKIKDIIFSHTGHLRRQFGEAKLLEGKILYDADKIVVSLNTNKDFSPSFYLNESKKLLAENKNKSVFDVFGVKIDNLSKNQVLKRVDDFLIDNKQHTIFTPNPEMLVDAQKDEEFKKVLNSGDLNVCDGVGLLIVARLSSRARPKADEGSLFDAQSIKGNLNNLSSSTREKGFLTPQIAGFGMTRYPGTDLMQDICALAEKEDKSMYLLGSGSNEVVKKTAEALKSKYNKLKICGMNSGPQIAKLSNCRIAYDESGNDEILQDIIMTAPDILFVAFGHVKQEKWIYENLKHLPSVKIAMGVGGAFDYISGRISRAPLFLRKIGLEWIYRLFTEPKRVKRILKATIVFLYLFIINK